VKSKAKIAAVVVLLLGVAAVVGVIALVLVGLNMVGPLLERRIVEEARERGVALEVGELDWSIGQIEIKNSRFQLIGVDGIRGEIESAEIGLNGFEPVSIDATGIDVRAVGSAAALVLQLSEWTKNYPQTYDLRVVAKELGVRWTPTPGGKEWLTVDGGTVVPTQEGGRIGAESAHVAGIDLGKIGAAWSKSETVVGLGFGIGNASQAPVRIVVKPKLARPTADITLMPVDLNQLAGPLGVALPIDGVTASGVAHLEFPPPGEEGEVTGNFQARLDGYIPPHPAELDGFMFGKTTKFASKLVLSEDRRTVTLTDSKVTAGAFALRGRGTITRPDQHARVQLGLQGALACTALANAAAQSHLGQALGSLVGEVAKRALKGSVSVFVKIDADTRDLAAAKMVRTIGVGCGLKPIDPRALEAVKDLVDLLDLPALPGGLPALPSAFPIPSSFPSPVDLHIPDLLDLPAPGEPARARPAPSG
jgi:hypothetical protein